MPCPLSKHVGINLLNIWENLSQRSRIIGRLCLECGAQDQTWEVEAIKNITDKIKHKLGVQRRLSKMKEYSKKANNKSAGNFFI